MKNKDNKNKLVQPYINDAENLVKSLRKLTNITQKDLGTTLKLTQQDISKLEGPNANLSLRKLSNICDALNVFPIIYFEVHHYTTIVDTELISCFHSLMALSPEKQKLIFDLIRLLY